MTHLKVIKSSRVDDGVRLQMLFARLATEPVESGRITDQDEALERIARAIGFLVNAERYICDPRGVWK